MAKGGVCHAYRDALHDRGRLDARRSLDAGTGALILVASAAHAVSVMAWSIGRFHLRDILRGSTGRPEFQRRRRHSTAPQATHRVGPARSVAAGDFNGDGKLDFAVTNEDDSTVSVCSATATDVRAICHAPD